MAALSFSHEQALGQNLAQDIDRTRKGHKISAVPPSLASVMVYAGIRDTQFDETHR